VTKTERAIVRNDGRFVEFAAGVRARGFDGPQRMIDLYVSDLVLRLHRRPVTALKPRQWSALLAHLERGDFDASLMRLLAPPPPPRYFPAAARRGRITPRRQARLSDRRLIKLP
jgi:hypothetical protein